jgi:uncharacterized protein
VNVEAMLARRRAERAALLDRAARFAEQLDPAVGARAVVVFGSVARGDFNLWSDIDVLVVADHLPDNPLQRLEILGPTPGGVQPVAWTPSEWRAQLARRNPIAVEASKQGVWLIGSRQDVDEPCSER